MSLLDKASLCITPNAYKENILYSVIPNTTLGDMDVVRATTATRVNSAGLIEVVPRNLLTYSEQFTSSSSWFPNITGTSTATQTSDYGIAPNGTTTADRIQLALNGSTYADYVNVPTVSIIIGQVYTYSIYMKSLSGTKTLKFFLNSGGTAISKTITTEWQRYTHTFTAVSVDIYPRFLLDIDTSNSADLLAWGYQLDNGSSATEYFPTTTRLNIPRIDYTNGSCPSLLVEPQRTNLYFPSIPNISGNGTYTLNDTISPDGTQNASSFVSSGFGAVFSNAIVTTVQTYTFSVYLKGTVNGQKVGLGDNGVILNTFTITTSWQRYTFTFTGSIQVTPFYLLSGNYFSPAENNKFYIYGAQLEQGSYATSYIPTVASTVTRNADVISKTGISSLIGQTEGTIFLDYIWNNNNIDVIPISIVGDLGKFIWFRNNGVQFYGNSSSLIFDYTTTPIQNNRYKLAFIYGQNNFKLFINGSLIFEQLSGTFTGSFSQLIFNQLAGTSPFDSSIKHNSVQLYKTILSNQECIELTTL